MARCGILSRRLRSPFNTACIAAALAGCASLPPFRADLGSMSVDGQTQRPQYLAHASYYGFLSEQQLANTQAGRAPGHAIYLWLPGATGELGVRVLSPAPAGAGGTGLVSGSVGDVREPAWVQHSKEKAFFDASLRVERCTVQLDPTDLSTSCAQWVVLGANDDSPELPANPNGRYTNALLRLHNREDDPTRALLRGLYRMTFIKEEHLPAQGTFVLQVAAPIPLDDVVLARTLPDLADALLRQQKGLPLTPVLAPPYRPYQAPLPDNLAPLDEDIPPTPHAP